MVKSQQERVFIVTNIISPNGNKKTFPEFSPPEGPPKIPPRMKKKGPALPEKPPHMKAKPNPTASSQPSRDHLRPRVLPSNIDNRHQDTEREVLVAASQPHRDPLRPRMLSSNIDNRHQGTEREVLVAASRGVRERPVEKRQREPAKLLMPTTGGTLKKDMAIVPVLDDRLSFPTKKSDHHRPETMIIRKSRPPQPILLIPRGMLPWGSTPVSYALWMQREGAPAKGVPRREPVKPQLEASNTSARPRSGSVTRSGSLTSQGSSSSDSGNETFPKSVLKKQKRNVPSSNSKGSNNTSKKMEQKKNVTFNAFATVQLMEQ